MKPVPRFELVPILRLRIHEEIHPDAVGSLVERIRTDGQIERPILVSSEGWVILDGHHRFAALKSLGARRVPAWVVDYAEPSIRLERWQEGPPIAKSEVLARATEGRPYPPKTTRHRLDFELPERPTRLVELVDGVSRRGRAKGAGPSPATDLAGAASPPRPPRRSPRPRAGGAARAATPASPRAGRRAAAARGPGRRRRPR